ncbi:hypothetical protein, partial [Chryseosolibacter indicus]|uniref:hypothetical protein n=1 Tax=Chryseosolibacter indicus TaxID=2782351 RepID=UPI0020B1AB08
IIFMGFEWHRVVGGEADNRLGSARCAHHASTVRTACLREMGVFSRRHGAGMVLARCWQDLFVSHFIWLSQKHFNKRKGVDTSTIFVIPPPTEGTMKNKQGREDIPDLTMGTMKCS